MSSTGTPRHKQVDKKKCKQHIAVRSQHIAVRSQHIAVRAQHIAVRSQHIQRRKLDLHAWQVASLGIHVTVWRHLKSLYCLNVLIVQAI